MQFFTETPKPSKLGHDRGSSPPSIVESMGSPPSTPEVEPAPEPSAPALRSVSFALKLARALHRYGAPAHRLEAALEWASGPTSGHGQFFSMPTAILASFADSPDAASARTFLVRTEPGEVNLQKLSLLDEVIEAVAGGQLSPTEAEVRVDRIVASGPIYGPVLTTLSYAGASAASARFLGGGWREIAVAAGLGLVIGGLAIVSERAAVLSRVFEPLSAFIAALLAVLSSSYLSPVATHVSILAGLIVLLPGLSLTVAMTEVSTRHLASGTTRLTAAGVLFLAMGFGVALGMRVGGQLVGDPTWVTPLPLPEWTLYPALLMAATSLLVLFRAGLRDLGLILLAAVIAFAGARAGSHLFGPELGAFVGALLLGTFSNAVSRWLRRPASVPLVPGIMLLVPGSIGFRSITSLLENDVLAGIGTAFSMVLVAMALVTGVLMANVLFPPRGAL